MTHATAIEGYVNPGHRKSVHAGQSIAILLDPSATGQPMNETIARNVGRQLEPRGYSFETADSADLVAIFGESKHARRGQWIDEPLYDPPLSRPDGDAPTCQPSR